MHCPHCAAALVVVGRYRFCGSCGRSEPGPWQEPATPAPVVPLDDLPAFVAIPLDRLSREPDPLLRLWRLCDAAEALVRFVFSAVFADAVRRCGGSLPPRARWSALRQQLERPTLAGWRHLVREVLDLHAELSSPTMRSPAAARAVMLLQDFFVEHVEPLLGTGRSDDASRHVLPLRNLLAHGGGLGRGAARELLAASDLPERLEEAAAALGRALGGSRLVWHSPDGRLLRLHGVRPTPLADAPPGSADGPRLALVTDGEPALDLTPLCGFGVPRVRRLGLPDITGQQEAPELYRRWELARLQYTVLDDVTPFSEGSPESAALLARMLPAPVTPASGFDTFDAEVAFEAAGRIGRDRELAHMVAVLRGAREGVFWLSACAGAGKSVLMASLASELAAGGARVLFHRFRAGDQRCSLLAFLSLACEALRGWDALAAVNAGPPPARGDVGAFAAQLEALIRAVHEGHAEGRTLMILLDGIDEVARTEPDLVALPTRLAGPGVCWVVAGRPDELPRRAFQDHPRVQSLFPPTPERPGGGLPPMAHDDVHAMLMEGIDDLRYRVLGGPPARRDELLRVLCARSDGLPLYVHFAIEDLRSVQLRPESAAEDLPESLGAYFDTLLRRYGVGDVQMVLTPIVALVTLAHEPLSGPVLEVLLRAWNLLTSHEEDVAPVQAALFLAGAVLERAMTPDGEVGYRIFHDALRDHIRQRGGTMQVATRTARETLCRAALRWAEPALAPARGYLLRHGVKHLIEHDRAEEARALVTDLPFAAQVAAAAGPFALADMLESVAGALHRGTEDRAAIERLADAVRIDGRFIERWPEHFAQTAWNRCYWHDASAIGEFVEGEARASAEDGPLARLVERWRAEGARVGATWARAARPLPERLGSSLRAVWPGDPTGGTGILAAVRAVAIHPDGRRLASATSGGRIDVRDRVSGALEKSLARGRISMDGLAFLPDGRTLLAAGEDGRVTAWDLETSAEQWSLRAPSKVENLAVSGDGRWVAAACLMERVAVAWRPGVDDRPSITLRHGDLARSVALSADGRFLASGGDDRKVHIRETEQDTVTRTLDLGDLVLFVAFAPDAPLLAVAERGGTLSLWDVTDGSRRWKVRVPGDVTIEYVTWRPDGLRLALGLYGGRIVTVLADDGARVTVHEAHDGHVRGVAYTPDGAHLVSGGDDATVRVWRDTDAPPPAPLLEPTDRVGRLQYAPDGRLIATTGWFAEHDVQLWSGEDGRPLALLGRHTDKIEALAFSPDGRLLVTTSNGFEVRLWDVESRALVRVLRASGDKGGGVAFSPDGLHFATSSSSYGASERWRESMEAAGLDLPVRSSASFVCDLWSVGGDAPLLTFPTAGSLEESVLFARSGALAVLRPNGSQPVVWDLASGTRAPALEPALRDTRPLALDGSGRAVITRTATDQVAIVDLQEQSVMVQVPAPTEVCCAEMTADWQSLLLVGDRGAGIIWRFGASPAAFVIPPDEGDTLVSHVRAGLTPDSRFAWVWRAGRSTRLFALEDGRMVEELAGLTDPSALRRGPLLAPLLPLSEDGATVVWDRRSARVVTRLPLEPQLLAVSPADPTRFAAAREGHLYVFAVEG